MFHHSNTAKKYVILFFIIFKCMIAITANPLATDTVEAASPINEDKIAAPEELEPNVDDVSKTAAISPSPTPIDDEIRSVNVDEVNDDSVTSEIIARTDFSPTEEVKEKRSADLEYRSLIDDSDFRSDLDDLDMADTGPVSRADIDDEISKSADDSANQDQGSDTVGRSDQDNESKAATEIDDSIIGRSDTEANNERIAPTEESSDDVRSEDRDAEATVELDSPSDGFIRGSRRMMESGDILETKGRSGENVDIMRTVPTPDLRSLNALNPFGSSSSSRRSFKSDIIMPHVHTMLNNPNVLYPNVYGIPTVMNRVASGEMNPISRSFPFRPDNGANSHTHTHARSTESNSVNQIKPMEQANTYPYIPTQNPMDVRQLFTNNVDIMKKLSDASSLPLPIRPTLFSAENLRPYTNLFNPSYQGFPPKMPQYNAPRIRRSLRKQRRLQQNSYL